jgi:hypothetical protein
LKILVDAPIEQVVVVRARDHEKLLLFRPARIKERLTLGKKNQVVSFAVNEQAGFAESLHLVDVPEAVIFTDSKLFHGKAEELQQGP